MPNATGPNATGPTATGPTATGPTATGPTATGPTATGPTATGPTATGPTATGPGATGPGATDVDYRRVVAAVEPTGMIVRGGFVADDSVPPRSDGRATRTVVMIGNAGGAIWPHFRRGRTPGPDPLDRWTREVLRPIARRFDADYVHPSDEPYQPFQRWAQRADDVWPSPIGLMIHAEYGLWHAYRGAFLFASDVRGLPPIGGSVSPCETCADRPCLTTCPVDAFSPAGYDADACRTHVRSGSRPACRTEGCAARRGCPIGTSYRYGSEQMRLHMAAFVGDSR